MANCLAEEALEWVRSRCLLALVVVGVTRIVAVAVVAVVGVSGVVVASPGVSTSSTIRVASGAAAAPVPVAAVVAPVIGSLLDLVDEFGIC